MIATIIICVVLAFVVVFAIISGVKKGKSGCCGSSNDKEKPVVVSDTNVNNYPYTINFAIKGMHCEGCKTRIENSLNRMDGVWATVDLANNKALVRMKKQYTPVELSLRIDSLGYSATEIK